MLTQVATTNEWLTEAYDYEPPRRGQLCTGVILKRDPNGITVDLGLKRDGFVPQSDIERLDEETVGELRLGQEIMTRMVKPGLDDSHILSVSQAQQEKDWKKAQALVENDEICQGEVVGYNQGGVLVGFGQLQAFVPASHLVIRKKHSLSSENRKSTLKQYVGQELPLKTIEVNRDKNRLIMSERLAEQDLREENLDRLLNELVEGEVHRGTVRHLAKFGAFVDLGGADGLVHNSELAWRKIRHPSEIVEVGDEIDVYIQSLDHDRKRISLSLKRLHPDPWLYLQDRLNVDDTVTGTVTSIADFGTFVAVDEIGVEGLVHISELSDPPPEKPQEVVQQGDRLALRVLKIEPLRQRLGLSLKRVTPEEREAWLSQ